MKQYTTKFWIKFWTISTILLVAFYFVLQLRNAGLSEVVDYLPISQENKTIATLAEYFYKSDDIERTFLILFQNNMEIRPGGGYIGSFGILKVKNGEITLLQTHDLSNFDGRIPDTVEPPYPMKETLHIPSWKMRDSNFSPDFTVNAKKAEEFYYMGQGGEKFEGVIGITTNVLTSLLKVTGPIQVEGYAGTLADENAILELEYQVEKAYVDQGIPLGERKSIMNKIAQEIIKQVFALSAVKKMDLYDVMTEDLNRKDIQIYFKDPALAEIVKKANWDGRVDAGWKQDYLMTVDANLGAWKSDYYVKRSIDYIIDLAQDVPVATLRINYNHTATKKDFMTKDYLSYLRVYVPQEAWMTKAYNFDNAKFGTEFGKKYFGSIVKVSLGQSKTVEINYTLPEKLADNYNLKIQKQAGINDEPVAIHLIDRNGVKTDYEAVLNSDFILNK
ncbi:MAG: hypothetical protein UT50_C0001G0009 [Candidatus Moranbacteria bacterium GW2011_GWA2_39_41]|nr:MAG: hypothetical protein UT50_C0001G0009 [Candidatus Moranbacteria bacterium GW2011_GWA2_39_41]